MGQQLFALAFVEAKDGVNIGTAVAVFGEEPGDRFRRMVGAYHYAVGHSGDAVLRLHAFAGFFITANKVAKFDPGLAQRLLAGQHGALNIDR